MSEAAFQAQVIRWLKQKGCYVIKLQAGPGVPAGAPDVIALIDGGGWIGLELKASKNAKFQPLQKATIAKLDDMFYCRVAYPENWQHIKDELSQII